jgi:hypothetical protein
MSVVQDFIRSLRADLVEKHLWPVAALLIAAAIAIPLGVKMTSSSTTAAPSATPALPAAPTSAPGAGVSASGAAATTHSGGHLGSIHDPFASTTGGSGASAGATGPAGLGTGTAVRVVPTTGAPTTPTTSSGGTVVTGGGQTAKPVTPSATPTPVPVPVSNNSLKSLRLYHVAIHFGQGTSVSAYKNVTRLDAFPSTSAPVAQYLGALQSGKKVAFLLWNAVSATGDGVCRQGKTLCDIVELKPGGSEFIDVAQAGGGVVQYELDVDSVNVKHASDKAQAIKDHARQSTAGTALILKSQATALTQLKYSTVLGTLVSSGVKAANAALHPHAYISAYAPRTPSHK